MQKFDYVYELLVHYKAEKGNLEVPIACSYHGYNLGNCVHNIRNGRLKLSDEERDKLDSIGFIWRKRKFSHRHTVEEICELLDAYQKEYGNLIFHYDYETKDGIKLGCMLYKIDIGERKLSDDDKKKMEEYPYQIVKKSSKMYFEEFFSYVLRFVEEYHHCKIPQSYVTKDGVKLGRIAASFQYGLREITDEQKKRLEDIGFEFGSKIRYYTFDEIFELLQKYKEEYGHCTIMSNYYTKDHIPLGYKLYLIKIGRRKISSEQKARLDSIGFDWSIVGK